MRMISVVSLMIGLAVGIQARPVQGTASPKAGDALNVDLGGGVKMEMAWLPAGEFLMGSPESEPGREKNEGPQHRVILSQGFWMGKYLVTQAQYEQVMGATNNLSRFKGSTLPVQRVSWNDAVEFAGKIKGRSPVAGGDFRLPTEAQWEYACRAGTTTPFHTGNALDTTMANIRGQQPVAVGSYQPNAWGLCDMHGNMIQWCLDGFGGYPKNTVTDPVGLKGHPVIRNGAWDSEERKCRSAFRWRDPAGTRKDTLGFRLVLVMP